jgi:hypothetical protein
MYRAEGQDSMIANASRDPRGDSRVGVHAIVGTFLVSR